MKKKKRLILSRETLRALGVAQMAPVVGGSGCPTCADQTCASCYGTCFYSCPCTETCATCDTCPPCI